MKPLFPLLSGLFLLTGILHAQTTGTLSGRVLDQRKHPILGATVRLLGTSRGAIVRSDGSFIISRVPAGTCDIKVAAVGYGVRLQSVQIDADHETRWDFMLAPAVPDTTRIKIPEEGMKSPKRDWNTTRPRSSATELHAPQSLLAPNADETRSKAGPAVTGRQKPTPGESTFTNLQKAVARAGGVSTPQPTSHDHVTASPHVRGIVGEIRIDNIKLKRPRIPKVSYARYVEDGEPAASQGFTIRGSRGEINLFVGIEVGDPFVGGFGSPTDCCYSVIPISEEIESIGGFEPEFGDVVNLRPEEIGTDVITPVEYCRVTGSDPYRITDSRFTSFVQSLSDPFSADGRLHRRGSFPRRRSSIIHYYSQPAVLRSAF
ncbi:MAG: TonB-dependent outer membrane protein SusC/RagA [Chlorobi bacterium]|nr:TonB-dependent outer membrane protein SusC/RagA [Chlorobiota bacterium]